MYPHSKFMLPDRIRILDVFSGAGGMALGWIHSLGGRADYVAAIDEDASLEAVYEFNHPKTCFVNYSFDDKPDHDQAGEVARQIGVDTHEIDVLLAGPPCQTLSSAGKRIDHPDNRLVFRVCDLVHVIKPQVVVIENVPEFSYIHDGRLAGRVRVQLNHSGYTTEMFTLNATAFGVPQARLRCFIVGVRHDLVGAVPPAKLRPRSTHVAVATARQPALGNGHSISRLVEDSLLPTVTVEEAIGDLPPLAPGEASENVPYPSEPNTGYQRRMRCGAIELFNHIAVQHSDSLVRAMSQLAPGETPQRHAEHPLAPKSYFRSAYARLHPNGVAPTVTTNTHNAGSGRFTHYRDHRVLTVREAARLQSFPDVFRFIGNSETQRRHVGNAVPPLVSEAIADTLKQFLQ